MNPLVHIDWRDLQKNERRGVRRGYTDPRQGMRVLFGPIPHSHLCGYTEAAWYSRMFGTGMTLIFDLLHLNLLELGPVG